MKRATPKAMLKLIAATSVAIFSLAAVFTATSAWFQSRRELEDAADAFNVKNLSGRLASVSFHQMTKKTTDKNGDATSATFNKDPVGTIDYDWVQDQGEYVPTVKGDAKISLKQYDPMDRNQPLLILLHLDQAYETTGPSIRVNGLTDSDGFLGARDSNNQPVYSLDDTDIALSSSESANASSSYTVLYYWLSSVVKFSTATWANDPNTWEYGMQHDYAVANNLPELTASPNTFTTVNIIDNHHETSSFNNAPLLFSSQNGQTIKNIALVVDYYPDAIEFIYSTYLANAILEDRYDGVLNFLCDWSLEVV